MSALDALIGRPRVTLSIALLLAAVGLVAWFTMPRLEDPEMSARWGLVISPYPGADPATIERTVVEPIEEELAAVAELKRVDSTSRSGVAIVTLELRDAIDVTKIDRIWDRVDEALVRASRDFPAGADVPELNRDIVDPEAIVLAVTGASPAELTKAAERLERALLGVPEVARVTRIGDPGEQVTVELDPTAARRLGITRKVLAGVLSSRHTTIPAGLIELDGRTASLRPDAEFHSVEEIAETPVPLANGGAVALGDVARVSITSEDPPRERMRLDRKRAVGLGVVPTRPLDLVAFGAEVRATVAKVAPELAPIKIHEVAFQPDYVEKRLSELSWNLVQSIVIVGGMLVLFMGLRIGLLVAAVAPLVTLVSLGIYALSGGVLHQMSIAALVIAIGVVVDTATVVAEDVQGRIDAGASKAEAVRGAIRSLTLPLGAAAGTTAASFIPMMLADGPVAEFTRALPLVNILTLVVSFVFALLITPVLAKFLKPSPAAEEDSLTRLGAVLSGIAVSKKGYVLVGAALSVAGSLALAPYVEQNFFPHGDRNQLIVDLSLPEGAAVERIDEISLTLEHALEERPEVAQVASFIGRGAPHFYYNLWSFPRSPHKAQLVVTTRDLESVDAVQAFIRDFARERLPAVSAAVKKLEQGPGITAPVEVRVYGDDLREIAEATQQVLREVKAVSGTTDVRETMGTGVPSLRIHVDDAQAARHRLSRSDVVLALLGETHGLEVGKLRTGEDPVPVLVRAPSGRYTAPDLLDSVDVASDTPGSAVPLAEIAAPRTEWLPAAIQHRGRRRVASVLAELEGDATYTSVMRQLGPRLDRLGLPRGVDLELGGVGEGSSDANSALLVALPIGLMVLIGFLLIEFNSFRRVAIILTTMPLAATGVIPGLLLGHQPFGFMSMLGVVSLAGVVVSNAIVLLDLADKRLAEGASVVEATREAVHARTRPILLTAGTTVVGLIPLTWSQSSLWPPLAWAMISGLTASTLLTLLVVPALYVLAVGPRASRSPSI